MRILFIILSAIAALTSCITDNSADVQSDESRYGVFIGADEDKLLSIFGYDVLIIDAENLTSDDIAEIHRNGNAKIYSYMNIGAVEEFREYYEQFLPYTLGTYENWEDERWVDVSSEKWQEHISLTAEMLADKGIDGIFADNADVYYVYPNEKIYLGLMDIFDIFSVRGIDVMVNGGDSFIRKAIDENSLPDCIKAVNQETVFTSIDFENGSFGEQAAEEREYFKEYAELCSCSGLKVYLIEYGADGRLSKEITAYCKEMGFECYFADSLELD